MNCTDKWERSWVKVSHFEAAGRTGADVSFVESSPFYQWSEAPTLRTSFWKIFKLKTLKSAKVWAWLTAKMYRGFWSS